MHWILVFATPLVLLGSSSLYAQEAEALGARIESYLEAEDEKLATEELKAILAEATPESIFEALRATSDEIPRDQDFTRTLQGSRFRIRVRAPKGHDRNAKALPVVFSPASNGERWSLVPDIPVIRVAARDFSSWPGQFSDLGRDAYLHALRLAAWAANGDLESLWMTGFSWAAHASFDTASHRPDVLRGIIPMGGGPRRRHFRLNGNLRGTRILSLCGGKDDPELIWNLLEFDRIKKKLGIDYSVVIDPDVGHRTALKGRERFAPTILTVTPREPWRKRGTLLADGPRIENRWLRIDAINRKKVELPRRIPVSARLDHDGKRRATIRAMKKAVVSLSWTVRGGARSGELTVKLRPKGVESATAFFRHSMVKPGQTVTFIGSRRRVSRQLVKLDARVMLEEARRTGLRSDPVIARFNLKF